MNTYEEMDAYIANIFDEPILIDLDSVVFLTHEVIAQEVYRKWGIKIDYEKLTTHDIAECYNIDGRELWELVKKVICLNELPPEQFVSTVLPNIIENYNVHFVTHRPDCALTPTIKQIKNLGVPEPYTIQIVNDHRYDDCKYKYMLDKNIKIAIEDKAETILDIHTNTDANILIFDRPWNRNLKETYRMRRVYSWLEINDLLK